MDEQELLTWMGFIGVCAIPGLIVGLVAHSLIAGLITAGSCILIGMVVAYFAMDMIAEFVNVFLTILGLNKNGK